MKKTNAPRPLRARRKAPPRAKKQLQPKPNPAPGTEPDMPCWFPTEPTLLDLPPNVHQALAHAIAPAYRAFVLDAPSELERTIGNSVVYLTWLELLNQIRLANTLANSNSADAILYNSNQLADRCLELMAAKCQAAGLMLKIRVATEALNRLAASQSLPNNRLPAARQVFPPDASPAPFSQIELLDHVAADSMPPRVANLDPASPHIVSSLAKVETGA